MASLVLLLALFGAMWFFTIRPQQQRLRAQRELVASIGVGDVVMTAGGLVGRIVALDDEEVVLDVGRGTSPVEVRMVRASVTRRVVPESPVDDA